ncbi:hypothetical protein G9Q86_17280 [Pseudomonas sp. CCUG 57209]|uniref:hypothetical protein n=1 Tax=Pseudomonas sivasensis TaxID=1880678 RepID=UPI0015ECC39F|nr:hypothetical protein [Pseudomonas sivasensis]MBA2930325.1 hypothetical protein [Pseudomonas sivasensis]
MDAVRVLLYSENYSADRLRSSKVNLNLSFECLDDKYFVVLGYDNKPYYFFIVERFTVRPDCGFDTRIEAHIRYGCPIASKEKALQLFRPGLERINRVSVNVAELIAALGESELSDNDISKFDPLSASEAKRRVSLMYGVSQEKIKISIEY